MRTIGNRAQRSVFFKLFSVVFLTGIVLNIVVIGGLFAHRPRFPEKLVLSAKAYAGYLASEFVHPENREAAKQRILDLQLPFRIESPAFVWSSSPDIPPLEKFPSESSSPPDPFQGGNSGPYVIIERHLDDGNAKVYVGGPGPIFSPSYWLIASLLFGITMLLAASFLALRYFLRPIRSLSEGVSAITEGNLEHRVPVETSDELGLLAAGFNTMVIRIKEMISSKQQLLLDVSHELRTPLSRARLSLELVKNERAVDRVTEELDELDRMIQDLLESARLDSWHGGLKIEARDLSAIVREAVESHRNLNHPLSVEGPDTLVLPLDAMRVGMILENVLANAIKYSPEGSPITVKLESTSEYAVLRVQDRGTGIPAEDLERVFEPFYRVDKSRTRETGGYGLGLSLCRKIATAHGGTIDLESTPGAGTTVRLRLPLNSHVDRPTPGRAGKSFG